MLGARQLLSLSLWAATVTASSRLVPLRPASSLMPNWKEVSPRGVGIHLLNVENAWVEYATEDQSMAFALFPYSEVKRLEAKRQIEAYYDAARACLQKHDMGIKYSKTKYLVVKDAVTVCLKSVSAPVFEVSDEDEMEQTQSPVPTTDVPLPTTLPPTPEPSMETPSPVVMSVSPPMVIGSPEPIVAETPRPFIAPEPSVPLSLPPAIVMQPMETAQAPVPITILPSETLMTTLPTHTAPPLPLILSPASLQVPPFANMDRDQSGKVTLDEWRLFVDAIEDVAIQRARKAGDSDAGKALLRQINAHYSQLGLCIRRKLLQVFAEDLDAGIFPSSALYIEHNCKLKFRFSVLGGLPPVEYFTRAEPLVNFKQLKQWVAKQMRILIRDAEEGRIQLDKDGSQVFQCIQAVLTSLESRNALGRATYYDLGAQIAACI